MVADTLTRDLPRRDATTYARPGDTFGGFVARRSLRAAILWAAVIVLYHYVSVIGFFTLGSTAADRRPVLATFETNTGLTAMLGDPSGITAIAAYLDWRVIGVMSLVTGVTELVKPLLDGVICAYHCRTGQSGEEVVGRLAAAGLGEFAQVRAALSDPAWAILGARRLVKPFGPIGVQWNPADEYCVGEVILDPEPTTAGGWRVSGQLRTALPGLSVVSST